MKRSRRLPVALHVLAHLAERPGEPRTSEDLARCASTNAVVVRRTLAGLRDAGLIESTAGPGGGWALAREAESISLGQVCRALGERLLFAMELAAPTGCRLQAAVTGEMGEFLDHAEAMLLERLDGVTIASLAAAPRSGSRR